ncbi:type I secretion C-terminal target domain-containing protein [Halieaceae bacterium]|nr:type I secretion C-terminal target domain-containing protein [Halieaceae bacterium]
MTADLTDDSVTTISNASGTITGTFENFTGGADTFADLGITLPSIEGLSFGPSVQTGSDPLTELFTATDVGGDTVFTLEVNEFGAYTFTLLKPLPGQTVTLELLDNVVAGGPGGEYIAQLPDGEVITITGAGTGDVNPSTQGLAIDNNNLDPAETLEFALPEPVSTVTFGAKTVNAGSLSLEYWNGSSWEPAGSQPLASDGSVTFGLNGASADLVRLTTDSGKFKITFITFTEFNAADPLDLPFTITGVDADGDTTSTTLDLLIDTAEVEPVAPPPAPLFAPAAQTLAQEDTVVELEQESQPEGSAGPLLATDGDDVFAFALSEDGDAPEDVVISGFGEAGNDSLDLRDLLTGEEATDDLSSYLNVTFDGANTVIEVSTSGAFKGNPSDAGAVDQTITLEGVDLVGGIDDVNQVIQSMLDSGKLTIDS